MPENNLPSPQKKTALDHTMALIKAGLSSVPFAGGAAVLLDEYVTNSTQRSIQTAIDCFVQRINALENRIDLTAANEDVLADTVKQFCRIALNTSSQQKLEAAANLLSNAMLSDSDSEKLSFSDTDYFSRCVDDLSAGAISLLGVGYDIVMLRGNQFPTHEQRSVRPPELRERHPDLDMDTVAGLVCELDSRSLVTLPRGPAYNAAQFDGGALSLWITPLGLRFSKHVLRTVNQEQ